MAKTKQKKSPDQKTPEDVSHLEETIEDLTTSTAVQFKKHAKSIAIVVGVIVLIAVGYGASRAMQRSQRDSLQARFYHLFSAPIAAETSPDEAGLQAFLAEIRGDESEKYMIKEWVSYCLEQGSKLLGTGPSAEPSAEDQAKAKDFLQKAQTLAEDLAARYPAAASLQAWKDAVTKKVDAATSTDWLPAAPAYQLPTVKTE